MKSHVHESDVLFWKCGRAKGPRLASQDFLEGNGMHTCGRYFGFGPNANTSTQKICASVRKSRSTVAVLQIDLLKSPVYTLGK